MSELSITFSRRLILYPGASGADCGTRGSLGRAQNAGLVAAHAPDERRHGCAVVRRITDERGREWRVRELWSEHCHGLLFQCIVPGIRSEVRPMRASLESLTDDELSIALAPADD